MDIFFYIIVSISLLYIIINISENNIITKNIKSNIISITSLNQHQYYNNISKIFPQCNITNLKKYTINTNKEYVKYLNYISCECKRIGYWGGFCLKKDKMHVGGNDILDIVLSNKLAELFKDKTVVDLGCGLGKYCPIISKKSKICDQFDGAVNIEEVTDGKIKYLNLAEPIKFECSYDVVMSIEVAEHIPKLYEEIYVSNLIKCCKEILLVTWSRIGQAGHFHVNNKNREDVIKLLEGKGLKYNSNITYELKKIARIPWLKNNILYFTR